MHLILGLPGFLAAGDALPPLPGLAQLLRAGSWPTAAADTVPHALAAAYGVARDGDWPLAALRLAALGHDPGTDWCVAADPVTLVAGRDDVRLAGPVADLDAGDAAALVARLNAHFASDGLRFVAATPGQWFLRSERAHAITTAPLARAIGAPLRELLPQGGDSPVWRRWQNEIEMLLHDQPINVRREAQGLPVANGLWFSDAGRRPAPVRATPGRMTLAADNAVRALAIHAGETCAAVPAGLDQALAAGGPATELVVVPAANADPAAVERQWSGPAWRALRAGSLARVTVIADGQGRALAWEIARPGFVDRLRSRFSEPDLSALLARGTADR